MDPVSTAATRAKLSTQGKDACRRALGLVGEQADVDAEPADDLRILDGQLAILAGLLREHLRDTARPLSRAEVADMSQALYDVHTVRFGIHDHLGYERVRRLDDLDNGLARLRRIVDQDELLEMACDAAAEHCGFDRVMLSRVEDGTWRPWRSYAKATGPSERAFGEWLRAVPQIYLGHMLLESEMVRRREPAIVVNAPHDPRVYAPLAEASGLTSYVAAPILSGDRVIGLLHADYRDAEVTELDRDILWFFAIGFAQIFERAVLLARLRDQRAEVMHVMTTVEAVLDELASAEIDLATREQTTALAISRPVRPLRTERPAGLEALLTGRELEVLALMATGATNERIAQRLVIATGTVKSHVKRILRKLRVENRAEAISYYLRLTIGAREG